MNVHFGVWNFDGTAVTPASVSRAKSALRWLAPQEKNEFFDQEIYLLQQWANGNTAKNHPFRIEAHSVLCWDGRLDNRSELAEALGVDRLRAAEDVEIVKAACDRWGTGALREFLGDWALSLWNAPERYLILAKDFLGAKPLYYTMQQGAVRWSNLLDPLALAESPFPRLNEEYIAGWFSRFPATHLTPYCGIHAVPPSSLVVIRDGRVTTQTFWAFDPRKRIFYRDSRDYEQHFLALFANSVKRRLRSKVPVLAELSGGMDSSAIVCMADHLLSKGDTGAPGLDTISYFEEREPNWDEAQYFHIVEERRGRSGIHLPVHFQSNLHPTFPTDHFAATPGSASGETESYRAHLQSRGYQVLLQGLGGDEVLGGIPAPSLELADLLQSARIVAFTKRLFAWSLALRVPAVHLGWESAREFLRLPELAEAQVAWLHPEFARRTRRALAGYPPRSPLLPRGRPSFRANLFALEDLRRHIGCLAASSAVETFERRYPYLDRELLEFLYAIPREQLLRPGQRRSLMRRSLCGLVPEEILDRKRKGFLLRAPVAALQAELDCLLLKTNTMLASDLHIVDRSGFQRSLRRAAEGQGVPMIPILRTLLVEAWLRHLSEWTPCSTLPLLSFESLESPFYTSSDARSSFS